MAVVAALVAIDVAGASYLWWLIDKRTAGHHVAPSHAGTRATTRP